MNPSHITIIIALISFAVSSVLYLHAFASEAYRGLLQRIAYGLLIFSTFLMIYTSINSVTQGVQVLTSGFILISALCLVTLTIQIIFGIKTLGTFVSPLATLLLLIQIFTAEPHGYQAGERPEGLIALHIYTSVIGEAFAILAFVISVLFLVQKRAMKKKQINRMMGMSLSLDALDRSLLISIWTGFIFLTVGLILGAIYTQFFLENRDFSVRKIVWALIVWFWYLATLLGRNVFSLPAKRIAQMTFVGFALMALGFFGLN